MGDTLDFDAYAERIGYRGNRTATVESLEGIVLGHAMRIPFENLDIHLGERIDLDPAKVFAKLVSRRRGGYCFEQNTLLLEMLRSLGFTVRPLAARVLYAPPGQAAPERPRSHMLLVVEVGARPFLADVGFGTHNMLAPLPFEPGRERTVHGETYRIQEVAWNGKVLGAPPAFDIEVEIDRGDRGVPDWAPLYRVSLEEQRPIDFAMASWFCETHAESLFVRRKIVSMPEVGTRHLLLDRELEVKTGGTSEKKVLESEEAYRAALREIFHIELGPDAILRW